MSSSIFDWFQLIAQNMWLYGGAFILVLSVLVFVHEWGHYIVARMCKVYVESFSIGFGREICGYTDKHGTRWKFSLIPLGGYVKMFGDSDPASARHINGVTEEDGPGQTVRPLTDAERKVAFFAKPVGQRSAIVFAGPAINFLFAIIILAGLYFFHGQQVTPPVAAAVVGGSAAEKAGFQPHDEIIAIDGKRIERFEDIRREVLVGLDQERIFTLRRGGQTIELAAKPEKIVEEDHFGFKHSRGMLGLISSGSAIQVDHIRSVEGREFKKPESLRAELVRRMGTTFSIEIDRGAKTDVMLISPLADLNTEILKEGSKGFNILDISNSREELFIRRGAVMSVVAATKETWNVTTSTLLALGQMIMGTRSATEMGGIIRIGAMAGDMAQSGILALLTFTALLSINLGLINLFPIPMLDGGHLFFYAIEAAKGSPISEQIQEYAFRLGLAILIGIMLFANLNDIVQLIL